MSIDYNAVAAYAGLIAAMAAVVAIWLEGRRARFSQGLDILLRMNDTFDSNDFKEKRQTVVNLLLKQGEGSKLPAQADAIDDLLNHFEVLGLLLRKRVLDEELVWAHYFVWLHYYFFSLRTYIASVRTWEPTIWDDVDWLHKRLIPLERKHRPKGSDIGPTKETLNQFLLRELKA
jgi:hypothetical protein